MYFYLFFTINNFQYKCLQISSSVFVYIRCYDKCVYVVKRFGNGTSWVFTVYPLHISLLILFNKIAKCCLNNLLMFSRSRKIRQTTWPRVKVDNKNYHALILNVGPSFLPSSEELNEKTIIFQLFWLEITLQQAEQFLVLKMLTLIKG